MPKHSKMFGFVGATRKELNCCAGTRSFMRHFVNSHRPSVWRQYKVYDTVENLV